MGKEQKDKAAQDIQWHPAFVSAMNLELYADRDNLVFEREHNLNTKPLEIDLLIIKKEKQARIQNEIGYFFREYNLLEYKAPGDHLDVDVYYKAVAYGCLYKSYAGTVDGRKAEGVTISLLRDTKPQGLFAYFKKAGTTIENRYKGIYYLSGNEVLFPTQVVVLKELEEESHAYLRVLTKRPQKPDVSRFLKKCKGLGGKAEQEYAESVLEVFTAANRKWMEQWKGEGDMGSILLELMEPELQDAKEKARQEGRLEGRQEGRLEGRQEGRQEGRLEGRQEGRLEGRQEGRLEGRQEGRQEGRKEGICGTVTILMKLGFGKTEIKQAVMEQYRLSETEAEKFLEVFNSN